MAVEASADKETKPPTAQLGANEPGGRGYLEVFSALLMQTVSTEV